MDVSNVMRATIEMGRNAAHALHHVLVAAI